MGVGLWGVLLGLACRPCHAMPCHVWHTSMPQHVMFECPPFSTYTGGGLSISSPCRVRLVLLHSTPPRHSPQLQQPPLTLCILTKGFGPKHVSQTIGISAPRSHPSLLLILAPYALSRRTACEYGCWVLLGGRWGHTQGHRGPPNANLLTLPAQAACSCWLYWLCLVRC